VTWHALSDRVDEGDIYSQRVFEIASDETSLTINMKCFEAGLASFAALIDGIEAGTLRGKPQNLTDRTYHARHARPKAGATLDFGTSSEELARLARALNFGAGYANPLGLPKLRTATRAYNVRSLEGVTGAPAASAHTIISADGNSALIATADGAIRIGGLTDASGAAVPIGAVLRAGDRLPELTAGEAEVVDAAIGETVRHETFFRKRLQNFRDLELHRGGRFWTFLFPSAWKVPVRSPRWPAVWLA
jgi:methionyl-tRNA formyltransferase